MEFADENDVSVPASSKDPVADAGVDLRSPLKDLSNQLPHDSSSSGGKDKPSLDVTNEKLTVSSCDTPCGEQSESPACSTPHSSAYLDTTTDYESADEGSPEKVNLTEVATLLEKFHVTTPKKQASKAFVFPYSPLEDSPFEETANQSLSSEDTLIWTPGNARTSVESAPKVGDPSDVAQSPESSKPQDVGEVSLQMPLIGGAISDKVDVTPKDGDSLPAEDSLTKETDEFHCDYSVISAASTIDPSLSSQLPSHERSNDRNEPISVPVLTSPEASPMYPNVRGKRVSDKFIINFPKSPAHGGETAIASQVVDDLISQAQDSVISIGHSSPNENDNERSGVSNATDDDLGRTVVEVEPTSNSSSQNEPQPKKDGFSDSWEVVEATDESPDLTQSEGFILLEQGAIADKPQKQDGGKGDNSKLEELRKSTQAGDSYSAATNTAEGQVSTAPMEQTARKKDLGSGELSELQGAVLEQKHQLDSRVDPVPSNDIVDHNGDSSVQELSTTVRNTDEEVSAMKSEPACSLEDGCITTNNNDTPAPETVPGNSQPDNSKPADSERVAQVAQLIGTISVIQDPDIHQEFQTVGLSIAQVQCMETVAECSLPSINTPTDSRSVEQVAQPIGPDSVIQDSDVHQENQTVRLSVSQVQSSKIVPESDQPSTDKLAGSRSEEQEESINNIPVPQDLVVPRDVTPGPCIASVQLTETVTESSQPSICMQADSRSVEQVAQPIGPDSVIQGSDVHQENQSVGLSVSQVQSSEIVPESDQPSTDKLAGSGSEEQEESVNNIPVPKELVVSKDVTPEPCIASVQLTETVAESSQPSISRQADSRSVEQVAQPIGKDSVVQVSGIHQESQMVGLSVAQVQSLETVPESGQLSANKLAGSGNEEQEELSISNSPVIHDLDVSRDVTPGPSVVSVQPIETVPESSQPSTRKLGDSGSVEQEKLAIKIDPVFQDAVVPRGNVTLEPRIISVHSAETIPESDQPSTKKLSGSGSEEQEKKSIKIDPIVHEDSVASAIVQVLESKSATDEKLDTPETAEPTGIIGIVEERMEWEEHPGLNEVINDEVGGTSPVEIQNTPQEVEEREGGKVEKKGASCSAASEVAQGVQSIVNKGEEILNVSAPTRSGDLQEQMIVKIAEVRECLKPELSTAGALPAMEAGAGIDRVLSETTEPQDSEVKLSSDENQLKSIMASANNIAEMIDSANLDSDDDLMNSFQVTSYTHLAAEIAKECDTPFSRSSSPRLPLNEVDLEQLISPKKPPRQLRFSLGQASHPPAMNTSFVITTSNIPESDGCSEDMKQSYKDLSQIIASCSKQGQELGGGAFDFNSCIEEEAKKIAAEMNENSQTMNQHMMQSSLTADINSSEAGPITADEDFNKEEYFLDPNSVDLDYLSRVGGKADISRLTRQSLYIKFDPLVAKALASPSVVEEDTEAQMADNQSSSEEGKVETPNRYDGDERLIQLTPTTCKKEKDVRQTTGSHTPSLRAEISKLQELMIQQEQAHQEKADLVEELRQRIAELEATESSEKQGDAADLQKQLAAKTDELNRVKKELNEQVSSNKQLVQVMEEYEKTISQLVAIKEESKAKFESEKEAIAAERDQALTHLSNMELAFNDIHQKYERAKGVIETFHANEVELKKSYDSIVDTVEKQKQAYQKFKAHAADTLQKANAEVDRIRRELSGEVARHKALLKKSELKCKSLEESLDQKQKELREMTEICDELISKVQR